jgi:hypothetical protein
MTTSIATPPKLQFFTAGGVPLSGGKLYSYAAGTTTPLATYTSSTGGTANTNPVILDSRGEADVWFGAGQYKLKLTSSTDVDVWTVDNLNGPDQATLASLAASSGSSLVGYIQSGSGAVATTVQARLRQYVSVIDFGADTSGVSSSSAAFTNANNLGKQVVITKGTYLLSTSVTFTVPVVIEFGAVITVPNGVTLAFNKGMDAGVYQCFNTTGTGLVTFNPQYTTEGFAEWWGAAGGSSTDSGPAINKAIVALLKVQLMGAEYFSSVTIKIQLVNRELCGVGYSYLGAGSADLMTRIVVTSGSLDLMLVGLDAEPAGGINDFLNQSAVRNLYVTRSIAPVISSSCNGIKLQFTQYAQLENVRSHDSIYGFQFIGSVYSIVSKCSAIRVANGTGAGTDLWYGFYINGFTDIGAAGGNASLYLNYCNAACNNATLANAGSTGFYSDDAFSDTFMESPETVFCTTSIVVLGNASELGVSANVNFQIKNPISDQFYDYGIFIKEANTFGSVSISGGYYGPQNNALACVYIQDTKASVRIDGGQFVMNGTATAFGITLNNVSNAIIDKPQILESRTSGVNAIDAVSCYIAPFCKNHYQPLGNTIEFSGACNANYLAPFVNGNVNVATLGVKFVGTTNERNEINCTGLNSSAISGGSANKLTINGVQITSTGLTGTNLVSGVMT